MALPIHAPRTMRLGYQRSVMSNIRSMGQRQYTMPGHDHSDPLETDPLHLGLDYTRTLAQNQSNFTVVSSQHPTNASLNSTLQLHDQGYVPPVIITGVGDITEKPRVAQMQRDGRTITQMKLKQPGARHETNTTGARIFSAKQRKAALGSRRRRMQNPPSSQAKRPRYL